MSTALKVRIAGVFDEPGCDKNQGKSEKDRKKGCSKQLAPGAAAGGCAFDGAKIALQPVADVAHLVHGPIACEGNSRDNRHCASPGPQIFRTGFTTPYDINIIGEYNLVGELWQVKPLLEALGIRVLACIAGDARYNDIACAHRARVNMMVCSKAMINIATKMEQRWGIPYFEGSFYGIGDMSENMTPREMYAMLRDARADIMLSGGRSQFVALKARIAAPWGDEDDDDEEYEKKVMTLAHKVLCIGCTACSRICPKKCNTHAAAAM